MTQPSIRIIASGVLQSTGLRSKPNWWTAYRSLLIEVDGRSNTPGFATGDDCNCLINTIRQQPGAQCDVAAARADLERMFPDILPGWRFLG
eukprot:11915102-Karenia_brevis.AAC.1